MKKHATYIQQKQLNAKKRIIDRIVNAVNNQKMFTAIFTAKFWGVDAFKSHIYESEDYTHEFYSTHYRLNIWYNYYNYMFILDNNEISEAFSKAVLLYYAYMGV